MICSMYAILSDLIVFFFMGKYIYVYILKKINCRDSKVKKKKTYVVILFFF